MSTTGTLMQAVISHALQTGYFESVDGFEPKSAPGTGLTCSVWTESIGPAKGGLNVTSALIVLNVRIYTSMLADPPDAIDPKMTDAVEQLINDLSGDFDLGAARNVDLLGIEGVRLGGLAGYINVSGAMYRCFTITVPIIVNDQWQQVS